VTVRAAPKRLDGNAFSATGIIHGLVRKLYIEKDKRQTGIFNTVL